MPLIHLNIKESAYDKVINILSQFPNDEIEIILDTSTPSSETDKRFKAVKLKTAGWKFDRNKANAR